MLSLGCPSKPLAAHCRRHHLSSPARLGFQPTTQLTVDAASSKQSSAGSAGTPQNAHPCTSKTILVKQEYRRNVGVCLVNQDGLVFAGRRVDDKQGTWQMPQGGIDSLENPMVAAMRELKEETGISSARIVAQMDRWLAYDFPTKSWSQFANAWVKYRGQTQKWLLLHFYGEESEIDLALHGQREFSEYAWLPIEQLPHEVVDFKRHVYIEVAQEFGPIIAQRRATSCPSSEEWTM
ncbi:hypothetical protein WJX72_001012 [[Myrmecia] bisecta]|uniref:Nudix hydrolase domain-containing protein n=1 Tax=[Myrmecia] bisecta TaxID=41462 RepID=A0AAW1PZP7_9CHLO